MRTATICCNWFGRANVGPRRFDGRQSTAQATPVDEGGKSPRLVGHGRGRWVAPVRARIDVSHAAALIFAGGMAC